MSMRGVSMGVTDAAFWSWAEYVETDLQRFYATTGGETYLFARTPAADRHLHKCAQRGLSGEQAAYTGPWHVIRKHVTAEFREWVEEHRGTERLTLSQWRARDKRERDAAEWRESAEYALLELEELRRMTLERDAMILDAVSKGASKAAVARAIGLSRQHVHNIVASARVDDVAPFDTWETSPASAVEVAASDVWNVEPF
ncbi:hypothetical protein [Microbacterium sp. YY-01]|uniref:hypothetical protein n=1 Tax=Microbacterium sp. YY-01 TaxID=3421634 RepID=UPI003D16CCBF